MKVQLEHLVEIGFLTDEDVDNLKKQGYKVMLTCVEMLQDAIARRAVMQYPRTGDVTEQEKKEWMEALEGFQKLDIDAAKEKYNVTFLEREDYEPYSDYGGWGNNVVA